MKYIFSFLFCFFISSTHATIDESALSNHLGPYYESLYTECPELPAVSLPVLSPMYFPIKNGPKHVKPYSPCMYTHISQEQIKACQELTKHPAWSSGNAVNKYYDLHEESQFDRNLCSLATLMGVIIHGETNQDELSDDLETLDIRKLLSEGPYKNGRLSLEAQKLIFESLDRIDKVVDVHLHNLGYDEGNYLNPKIAAQKTASSKNYFQFMALRYAAGMARVQGSTHEARKRIHLYSGHFPKFWGFVLPIHNAYQVDGTADWSKTGNSLENEAALLTALTFYNPEYDSVILPAISVHPFDPKWREKLITARTQGICLVKWMPPQSIQPDSDLLDEYYMLMKDLGMTLIAHGGPEHAIPTTDENREWSDWGNPLRFRKPLRLGVNVILAHCGHKDEQVDLDHPNDSKKRGYELFFRLAREAHKKNLSGEWSGKLFGDLAAVTNHYGPDFVEQLLKVVNEEGIRFVYGSDYPYTNLVQPKDDAYDACAKWGLLDPKKVNPLKELRSWNPLLANYVFTKNLELKKGDGKKIAFPDSTFTGEFKDAKLILIDQDLWNQFRASVLENY